MPRDQPIDPYVLCHEEQLSLEVVGDFQTNKAAMFRLKLPRLSGFSGVFLNFGMFIFCAEKLLIRTLSERNQNNMKIGRDQKHSKPQEKRTEALLLWSHSADGEGFEPSFGFVLFTGRGPMLLHLIKRNSGESHYILERGSTRKRWLDTRLPDHIQRRRSRRFAARS